MTQATARVVRRDVFGVGLTIDAVHAEAETNSAWVQGSRVLGVRVCRGCRECRRWPARSHFVLNIEEPA